jgi:putative membrane protein
MNRIGFGLVAILAVVLGLLIGTFNPDSAHLDLLWVQLDWPLGLLILIAFVFGLLLGFCLVYLSHVFPLRLRIRKLQAKAARAAVSDLAAPND